MELNDLTIMVAQREHELMVKQSLEEGRIRRELAARSTPAAEADRKPAMRWLWRVAAGVLQGRWSDSAPRGEGCTGGPATAAML